MSKVEQLFLPQLNSSALHPLAQSVNPKMGGGVLFAPAKLNFERNTFGQASRIAQPALYVFPDGRVNAGTIGGVVPTIGGDPITDSPAPTLTIGGTGAQVVVVTLTSTLSVDSAVYVNGYTAISSVVITVEATNPGDAGMKSTSGVFEFALATFFDGEKTGQMWQNSLNIEVCDDGTGTATGQLRITQA